MAPNIGPTLLWLLVVTAGVAIIAEGLNRRQGTRQIIQVVVGAVLVLAFVANAWAGFAHWAECEDHPGTCEEEDP